MSLFVLPILECVIGDWVVKSTCIWDLHALVLSARLVNLRYFSQDEHFAFGLQLAFYIHCCVVVSVACNVMRQSLKEVTLWKVCCTVNLPVSHFTALGRETRMLQLCGDPCCLGKSCPYEAFVRKLSWDLVPLSRLRTSGLATRLFQARFIFCRNSIILPLPFLQWSP